MTDETLDDAIPTNLTPEQKEAAKRRITPLLKTMLDVGQLKLDVTNLSLVVGPGGFDPQEIHHRLTTHFEEAKKKFEADIIHIKRMLAFEALRNEGRLSENESTHRTNLAEKMNSMDSVTRLRQRDERQQAESGLPGPR